MRSAQGAFLVFYCSVFKEGKKLGASPPGEWRKHDIGPRNGSF
jgi:hypothetical protein